MPAIKSQGTTIGRGASPSGGPYNDIEQVVSIQGPGGAAAVIDVTDLDSAAKEKLMGLPDEGQVQLVCNYDPDATEQSGCRTDRSSQTARGFQITFTDASPATASFSAYVTDFNVSVGVDEKVQLNITLEIDGAITWA